MREHMGLYRGKRIDNGKWIEGSFLQCGEAHRPFNRPDIQFSDCYIVPKADLDIVRFVGTNTIGLNIWAYHVDPDTVGECTGLRDKNGKLIFEGDICRNTKTGEIVSVNWHGTMAGFVWSKRKEKSHIFDFGEMFRAHDKYEVIGNVVDNPELLKGGEGDGSA